MAFDSTANLLFTIGADSSDAQANIQRFRSVLAKDLGQMKAEFSDWSTRVFGDLSSLKGAMTAGLATLAAGALAAGTALLQAAKHAAAYAEEIDDVNDATGISVEQVSRLRYSMETAGLEFNQGKQGLILFAAAIEAARKGTGEQFEAFRRMRISQREIEAGSRDMLPLLYRVADAFHDNANAVEKTANARVLMGRGGAGWVEFLSRGSAALKQTGQDAERLGKVLTEQDIKAAKEFKLSLVELEAQMKGLALSVGTAALPALSEFAALLMATVETMKKDKGGLFSEVTAWMGFFEEWTKASDRIRKNVEAAMASTGKASFVPPERPKPPKAPKAAKETADEYYGVSTVLGQIRMQLAGLAGDEVRIYEQAAQYRTEIEKAATELLKRRKEKALSDEDYFREFDAWTQGLQRVDEYTTREIAAINAKRQRAAIQATQELESRLEGLRDRSYEHQRQAVEREIALLVERYRQEEQYTTQNAALIQQIRLATLANIGREEREALARQAAEYESLLQNLQSEYTQFLTARMTSYERLRFTYEEDVRRFSWAAEQKALAEASSIEQMAQIVNWFGRLRQAALNEYGASLMVLYNSQGWQGVFGEVFARDIRRNEELLRRWSESARQSTMAVQVTVAGLTNKLVDFFDDWARAMGSQIAAAIVWRKSIGEALRQATAEALQSLAAKAYYEAIWATARGFIALAQWDFKGAAQWFAAAGLLASVGTGAAVAGRAIAPKESGSSSSPDGSTASTTGASGGNTGSQESAKPRVSIVINGHVIGRTGVEELAEIINDAVVNRDVRLVATQTRQRGRVSP